MQKLGAGASYPLPSEVGSCFLQGGEPVEKSPAGKGSGRSSELPGPPASMEFLMQPINRTLLEEVNENNNTMEPLHYPVMVPAEVELPAPAASSAAGQICVDGAAPEPASADKPQGSEHSIEQVDPRTPGWTQRVRVGAAALGRAPCPDRITALEKAVRRFAEEPGDIVIVPKIGTRFDTLGEAHGFYNLYSWEKGFGIRYGKNRLNVNRTKCMQEIVYGCAGRLLMRANIATKRHAGKIYTRTTFKQFCHIIYECGAYQMEEIEKGKMYVAIHTEAEWREKWCRIPYKVTVLDGGEEFDCECGQFAHMGMLCSHVLKVLDFIHIKEIPWKHIVKRWRRDARDILPPHLTQYQKDNAHKNPFSYRHFNM